MFAYAIDKMIAVFVGRPPRISKRYVHLETPMCIDDESLCLPPDKLEALVVRMGDAVWRYDDIRLFSTLLYANHDLLLLREDVLELFLGTSESCSRENLESRIK